MSRKSVRRTNKLIAGVSENQINLILIRFKNWIIKTYIVNDGVQTNSTKPAML